MSKARPADYPHETALAAIDDAARREHVASQRARGKRTARERVAALADKGTWFEIGALAHPESAPGLVADGIVVGTAEVEGQPVVLMATDFTVAGGSNGELGNEKQRRGWEIAATRGIPVVMLFDGGGHRIRCRRSQSSYARVTEAGTSSCRAGERSIRSWCWPGPMPRLPSWLSSPRSR